ncbi:hypothetical protein KSZ_34800 [Dictyobacter formicarum]|uniref:Uncharacterized protein n=1 Tax=Dictyobacter formicarum TaxID=2778368 RepID=A0ABQ3VIF2_9CHLR|nr:hypothetical protein KSZ_34800 [Dictyobacter formicarum]
MDGVFEGDDADCRGNRGDRQHNKRYDFECHIIFLYDPPEAGSGGKPRTYDLRMKGTSPEAGASPAPTTDRGAHFTAFFYPHLALH